MEDFRNALQSLLNQHCMENGSNTPDHILANYLTDCLRAWDSSVKQREHWYGMHCRPGGVRSATDPDDQKEVR